MTEVQQKQPKSKKHWVVLAVVGIVALVGTTVLRQTATVEGSISDSTLFKVRQGPLTISVIEKGTIKAREQVVLKSKVYGHTTILKIVPEGKRVKKGDLLVELDSSEVKIEVAEREISAENAEATWLNAREELAVVKNQAESDVDEAKLALRFAEEDIRKYIKGDFPKLVKEAETDIKLAETALGIAQDTLEGSRRLLKETFLTPVEFANDESAEESARLRLELREADLKLLNEYTYTRQIAQLESDVVEFRRALERSEIKARSDVVQAESNLRYQESEFKQKVARLERERLQLKNSTIYAPTDGLVVYATTGKSSWRGNDEPIEEGRDVREGEEIIHLPTADAVMAEVGIHESNLAKIKLGQTVEITVEALPGKVFTGTVMKISPMPDAMSAWMTPDLKIYNSEIYLDGDGSELRTGMTCSAEIIVQQHAQALYVPVSAVLRVGSQHKVYVKEGNQLVAKNVTIGLDNNVMLHIINGVNPGDFVSLTPPLKDAAKPSRDKEDVSLNPGGSDHSPSANRKENLSRPSIPNATTEGRKPRDGRSSGASEASAPGKSGGRPSSEFGNMSGEERRKMFENMSEEDRKKMRAQLGGGRGEGGGGRENRGDGPRNPQRGPDKPSQ